MTTSLRFLRPYLCPRFRPASAAAARAAHLRFYNVLQPQPEGHEPSTSLQKHGDVEQRTQELSSVAKELYPRVKTQNGYIDCSTFAKRYDSLKPGESQEGEKVEIRGMLKRAFVGDLAHAPRKGQHVSGSWFEAFVPRSFSARTSSARCLQLWQDGKPCRPTELEGAHSLFATGRYLQ